MAAWAASIQSSRLRLPGAWAQRLQEVALRGLSRKAGARLVREELELRDQLRRAAEAAGSRINPFHTAPSVEVAVNCELTRAGLRTYPSRGNFRQVIMARAK